MFFLSQPYVNVDIRNARTHIKNGKALYTDYEIKVQVSIVTTDNMRHEFVMIYAFVALSKHRDDGLKSHTILQS